MSFMRVELRHIDESNYDACIALKVASEQGAYICTNEMSLKEAEKESKVARPFAIYINDIIVGFTMFAFDEENENPHDKYWLWRFMIDESLQGKGYGRCALREIIKYFMENGADEITLSTKESNIRALNLYHQFGFRENGEMNEDEIVLKLFL